MISSTESFSWGMQVKQDNAEALRWFQRGAAAGNGRAMANLGWMYLSGKGVKRDPAEAARWFRRDADAGDARAMGSLGSLYLKGIGVQQNDAEAARWFKLAGNTRYSRMPKIAEDLGAWPGSYSAIGDARSMSNFALMLLEGRGVPKDEAEGIRWLRAASDSGDNEAFFHFTVLSASGSAGLPKITDIIVLKSMFARVESGPGDAWSRPVK